MKKVIGMIHLNEGDVSNALREIEIYQQYGLDGALVENYFGNILDVEKVLQQAQGQFDIALGVNILPNDYNKALVFAKKYDAQFIQLDHVTGRYVGHKEASFEKEEDIFLYGGVWPKYYTPVTGSNFASDLRIGMSKADAIVITGEGTGMQTPLEKLVEAREVLGNHELIVGAGVNHHNIVEQLQVADGCIIGSALKYYGNAYEQVDEKRVLDFMSIVRDI